MNLEIYTILYIYTIIYMCTKSLSRKKTGKGEEGGLGGDGGLVEITYKMVTVIDNIFKTFLLNNSPLKLSSTD